MNARTHDAHNGLADGRSRRITLVRLLCLAAALVLGLLMPSTALAQGFGRSALRGTATDPSGAVVPGVDITLVDVHTNASRAAVTSKAGDYEFADLLRGTYLLTAKATGFGDFVAEDIVLESGQTRRVDIPLKLRSETAEVTVRAGVAVIETESPAIAGIVSKERYDDLPLSHSRSDPGQSLTLLPGVVSDRGGLSGQHFHGQANTQIAEAQDGFSYTDTPVNQVNNMEQVEEMKVITLVAPAEYSRAGNMDLIFKSGGNRLQGKLYFRASHWKLNARDFFAPSKPERWFPDYGAQVSGPIIKDRLFFYAAWDERLFHSTQFFRSSVPNLAMRSGDFSQLLASGTQIRDPLTGTPFPGNIIPSNRLSPVSLELQRLQYPQPNSGPPESFQGNLFWNRPAIGTNPARYFTQRIDWTISEKNRLFWRWINAYGGGIEIFTLPTTNFTAIAHRSDMVISDTHTFSPTLVNTFRFGWGTNRLTFGNTWRGVVPPKGGEVASQVGLLGVNPRGLSQEGFLSLNITGFTAPSIFPGGLFGDQHNLGFADSVTWARGRHVAKVGVELKLFRDHNDISFGPTFGSFGFDGSLSGFSYADFLLGLPRVASRQDPILGRRMSARELGGFVQDSFKVTPRLTLDFGLRWDYFTSPRFEDGLMANWDPATGDVIVPPSKIDAVSPLYPSDAIRVVPGEVMPRPSKTNFRPRLGAAYRLTDKTVVRGGYGIFTEQLGRFSRVGDTAPFSLSETFDQVITDGRPLLAFPDPYPAVPGQIPSQSITAVPLETKHGLIHQFHATVEHQVRDIGFRLSYIGARDQGMNYSLNINKPQPSLIPFTASRRPFPQFVSTTVTRSDGRTKYDALQLQVQRKVGALSFDTHWTWARNQVNFLNLQNPHAPLSFNHDAETPRHRVVVNAAYDLPFGKGRRFLANAPGVVDKIVGGWRVYWLAFLQSGSFFTPSFSGSDPSNTGTFGGPPDRIGDGNLPPGERRNVARAFDPSAFAVPPPGRFGNSGVNILESSGYHVHHLTLVKSFPIKGRVRLEYKASAANLFNHPHFGFPSANISIPQSAGRIFGTVGPDDAQKAGPREIEMQLRLIW